MLPGTLERTPIGIIEQSQQGTVCTSAPHTAQLWNNLIQEKNKHTKKPHLTNHLFLLKNTFLRDVRL